MFGVVVGKSWIMPLIANNTNYGLTQTEFPTFPFIDNETAYQVAEMYDGAVVPYIGNAVMTITKHVNLIPEPSLN